MTDSIPLSSPARWAERAANSAVFLCNGLGIGAWAASIPLIQSRLGLSDGALSLVLLGFAAGAVLSMPLTGRLAPRLGVARATRLCALAFAVAMLAPGLAPDLPVLIGAAFVLGLANGGLDVSMNGLASGIETRWGAPIMSSFHAAFSVGGLGGAALGALMAIHSSPFVNAMSLVALINVATALLAWRALHDPEAPAQTVTPAFALPGRAALWLCTCVALGLLLEGAIGDWSAVYLANNLAAPPSIAAAGYGAFSAAMIAGRLGGDRFVARFGHARTVRYGGLVSAAGIAVALIAPQPLASAIGFGLVGIGVSNVVPIVFSAAARTGSSPAAGVAMAASAGYSGLRPRADRRAGDAVRPENQPVAARRLRRRDRADGRRDAIGCRRKLNPTAVVASGAKQSRDRELSRRVTISGLLRSARNDERAPRYRAATIASSTSRSLSLPK